MTNNDAAPRAVAAGLLVERVADRTVVLGLEHDVETALAALVPCDSTARLGDARRQAKIADSGRQ